MRSENSPMDHEVWKEKFKHKIMTPKHAVKSIKPGAHIFIGTGCGEPQTLVHALADFSTHIIDAGIYHFLTMGATPHLVEVLANKYRVESFFINSGVRETIWEGWKNRVWKCNEILFNYLRC